LDATLNAALNAVLGDIPDNGWIFLLTDEYSWNGRILLEWKDITGMEDIFRITDDDISNNG